MRKIIIFIFLVLTFICSCSEKSETPKAIENLNSEMQKVDEHLNNAIKLQPNNAENYNKRGEAYYNLNQYQRALNDFNKAISLKQDYALTYSNRGNTYFNLGQYQQAIEDLNKAIRLQPDFEKAYRNRAIVYLNRGNTKLGCADAHKACELRNCEVLEWAKGKGVFCP